MKRIEIGSGEFENGARGLSGLSGKHDIGVNDTEYWIGTLPDSLIRYYFRIKKNTEEGVEITRLIEEDNLEGIKRYMYTVAFNHFEHDLLIQALVSCKQVGFEEGMKTNQNNIRTALGLRPTS